MVHRPIRRLHDPREQAASVERLSHLLRQPGQHEMIAEPQAHLAILERMPFGKLAGAELGVETQQRLGSDMRLFHLAAGRVCSG